MATRIYVAKYTKDADTVAAKPELEAWDYVEALRSEGYQYVDEIQAYLQQWIECTWTYVTLWT